MLAYTTPRLCVDTCYHFQVRAVNSLGEGPWSEESYSFSTLPTHTAPPMQPTVLHRTQHSIRFEWLPPKDCGSAVTAYTVCTENTRDETVLPRTQLHYTADRLLPGELHRIKVKCRNTVGWSEYSPWSPIDSRTLTDVPEVPSCLLAVGATSSSMALQGRLPYDWGSPINSLTVQHRVIQAFSKGAWEALTVIAIPTDVLVVEHVDVGHLMKTMWSEECKTRSGIGEDGQYQPFKRGPGPVKKDADKGEAKDRRRKVCL